MSPIKTDRRHSWLVGMHYSGLTQEEPLLPMVTNTPRTLLLVTSSCSVIRDPGGIGDREAHRADQVLDADEDEMGGKGYRRNCLEPGAETYRAAGRHRSSY